VAGTRLPSPVGHSRRTVRGPSPLPWPPWRPG
jgi:hypothetical protein